MSAASNEAAPPTSAADSASASREAGGDPDERRDLQALARFELFLFTAVATVLIIRTALAVTGYPQVGGSGLHIAHVLWGGLLMGLAIVLVEILPGTRIRVRAAFLGGIGFGLFIDEVGKFLTTDVNYFFKPAISIMYAVFVVAYLLVRFVLQRRKLNDRRRLALATTALADLVLGQLDRAGRDYAVLLLDGVDETSALSATAAAVREGLLAEQPKGQGPEVWATRLREKLGDLVDRVMDNRRAGQLVWVIIALAALDIVVSGLFSILRPEGATVVHTLLDTALPSAVSIVLLIAASVVLLGDDRDRALQLLQVSLLIEILFTQVVIFNRQQWLGLIGFGFDVLVISLVRVTLSHTEVRSAQS